MNAFLLLSLLLSSLAAEAPVRADVFLTTVNLGVRDGAITSVMDGERERSPSFSLMFLDITNGQVDMDRTCTLTWAVEPANAVAVDVSAWPVVWPDAAWHIDTQASAVQTAGACADLDVAQLGANPVTTLAGAGWNVGFGPLTPAVALRCEVKARNADATVVTYVWMDGARPMPASVSVVEEVDETGALTGEGLHNAATATSAPAGWYPASGVERPCTIGLGV